MVLLRHLSSHPLSRSTDERQTRSALGRRPPPRIQHLGGPDLGVRAEGELDGARSLLGHLLDSAGQLGGHSRNAAGDFGIELLLGGELSDGLYALGVVEDAFDDAGSDPGFLLLGLLPLVEVLDGALDICRRSERGAPRGFISAICALCANNPPIPLGPSAFSYPCPARPGPGTRRRHCTSLVKPAQGLGSEAVGAPTRKGRFSHKCSRPDARRATHRR